jgi:PKHD-type hydroxylase
LEQNICFTILWHVPPLGFKGTTIQHYPILLELNAMEERQPTILGDYEATRHSGALGCVAVPGVFSASECQKIVDLGLSESLSAGLMQTPLEGYRRCQFRFLDATEESSWILSRLRDVVLRFNEAYQFRLSNFAEGMQFTRYESGGVIHWHVDNGKGLSSTRKISLSVQLSAPTDYEGGTFQMCPDGEPHFSRNQGSVIVFPSFLTHRVTEVTRGVRYALVVWAHGPAFS